MTEVQFRELAVAQLNAVYRLACHLAHSPAEAEDLVQETYLRAFRSADSFQLREHGIRPWLFKILHNVVFTRGSQQQREKLFIADLHQGKAAHESSSVVSMDCASMDWEHVDQRLKVAIAELPPVNRLAFMLWALEGLKYREIADVMEVPVGTVMSRLSRARTSLSEKLKGMSNELGIKPADRSRGDEPA